jgi:competence protein ComEC
VNGQRGRLRRLRELVSERRRERERPIGSARSWPDLRLAGPALACWLAAIIALRLDAGYGVLLAAAAALASMPALVVARRHRAGWVLLGVLLGVVCGATATAARVAVRDAKPLSAVAARHATVRAEVTVTDDPRPLRGSTGRPPVYAVPAELTRMTWQASGAVPAGSVTLSVRVLVLGADNGWRALLPGQRVIAAGRLGPARPSDLRAAVLSVPGAPRPIGEAPWVQRAAGRLRAGLQRACAALPREPGGLLPGLVVGDTSRLEPAVADDFTTTGMTHLLAVSGSNVGMAIVVRLAPG